MRRWSSLVLLLAAMVPATGVALANHNGRPSVDHYVQEDGSGLLIANPSGHPVSWTQCRPGQSACEPFDDGDGEPNFLRVRDAEPGTVFEATQDGVTDRSEPWRGMLRAAEPPQVSGEIRVGGHVRPVAATWEGGWGRETDWLQLQACESADGGGCKVILDSIKFGPCRPDGGRTLPARYEGSWLRVVDARIDREQPFSLEGYSAPEGIKPLEAAPGHAAATVGRIAAGRAPEDDCGRPSMGAGEGTRPTAAVRSTVTLGGTDRPSLARVTCPAACRVVIALRQRNRAGSVRRALRGGATDVALPRRLARRFESGRMSVRVRVDGRQVAARRAVLRLR